MRPRNQADASSGPTRPQIPSAAVTVIVPVYRDYRATAVCLESLVSAMEGAAAHQILVIDDATPDPRIARLLSKLAADGTVILERNPRNLGFVGSVNKALQMVARGDVILLNSDTIPPPRFVDRLSVAAHSAPDIGTVTPLSNHGELTSFPIYGQASPAPSIEQMVRLDGIAAKVNRGKIVDLPSGTGFCLYVTRSCLDAVGQLSEAFGRGYFEDVDLSLRAQQRGFRTVCAPSVYVGHAGSRSFRGEKSALVVRNFKILDQRFPDYLRECAAFAMADPLRPARAAIERLSLDRAACPRLLVSGTGTVGTIARARAQQLMAADRPVMMIANDTPAPSVRVFDPAGAIPQSLQFDLATKRERRDLIDLLRGLTPSAIEIIDPTGVSGSLLDLLLDLGLPLRPVHCGRRPRLPDGGSIFGEAPWTEPDQIRNNRLGRRRRLGHGPR